MNYKRQSKYNASAKVVNGIRFDSKKEAARYRELSLLERAGKITKLKLQPQFTLVEGYKDAETGESIRSVRYIADFMYTKVPENETVVEDVKGVRTEAYKLKKKMVYEKFGIKVVEV